MIRFEDVSKEFHTKAGNVQGLNHVNLHISKGYFRDHRNVRCRQKHLHTMYQLFRTSNFRRCLDRRMPNVRAVGTTAARDAKRNRNDFSALQSSDAEERTGKYLFFIKNSRS